LFEAIRNHKLGIRNLRNYGLWLITMDFI